MNVSGGFGSEGGDLPIYISALRPDSIVWKCGQIQVSAEDRNMHLCVVTVGPPNKGYCEV